MLEGFLQEVLTELSRR